MSGTEKAIEGIRVAYEDGMTCVPVAEKDPSGTVESQQGKVPGMELNIPGQSWATNVDSSQGLNSFWYTWVPYAVTFSWAVTFIVWELVPATLNDTV